MFSEWISALWNGLMAFKAVDIMAAIIGLVYIVSEYRASRWFWPSSLLMSAFYIFIDFSSALYANGTICIYNFVMSVYGLLVWYGWLRGKQGEEKPMSSCPQLQWIPIVGAVVVLTLLLRWVLGRMGESTFPWLDGFSSALSIVGMWMLSQKYWQQWFCWMIVEPLMVVLFWKSGNYASAILYVVYEVFCIMGIVRWRREYKSIVDKKI